MLKHKAKLSCMMTTQLAKSYADQKEANKEASSLQKGTEV